MLRAFGEHSTQTLHSHHLILPVCCFLLNTFHTADSKIGERDSGAESISRALRINIGLKSLCLTGVFFNVAHFTHQGTKLVIVVLKALQEHSNRILHSLTLIFTVCRLF